MASRAFMDLRIGAQFTYKRVVWIKIEPIFEENCCTPKYNAKNVDSGEYKYFGIHADVESEGPFIR